MGNTIYWIICSYQNDVIMPGLTTFNNQHISVICHFLPIQSNQPFNALHFMSHNFSVYDSEKCLQPVFPRLLWVYSKNQFHLHWFPTGNQTNFLLFYFSYFQHTIAHIKLMRSESDRRLYSVQREANTNNAQSRSHGFKIKYKMC